MTTTPTSRPAAPDPPRENTRAEWVRGGLSMLPIAIGLLPFGLLLGTAVSRSANPLAAWSATVPIYGGSAHLALVELLRGGAGLWAAAGAALLINVRLIVYSTSLRDLWSSVSVPGRMLAAAFVIDPTWMLAERRAERPGGLRARRANYSGSAVVLTVTWIAYVTAGAVIGSRLESAGILLIAIPLCLMAVVVPHLRARGGALAIGAAVLVALAGDQIPAGVGLLASMAAAAVVGGLTGRTSP